MPYLLDTHTFLWMRYAPERLGPAARRICGDVDQELALSLVSVWEISIKLCIGKLRLHSPLKQVLNEARSLTGIKMLEITETHILRVQHLPFHHRDPFDRLLAAQTLAEGLTLVSKDTAFDDYGVKRVW